MQYHNIPVDERILSYWANLNDRVIKEESESMKKLVFRNGCRYKRNMH